MFVSKARFGSVPLPLRVAGSVWRKRQIPRNERIMQGGNDLGRNTFCWIGGAQIASKLKIWSSLRFKATEGEQAPDWIASETLGISTMRSAGW